MEQRREVGLREGHRGDVLQEPVLRAAVQRLVQRRHDPWRVPLRHPEHGERRRAGELLRGQRRRLVPGRADPAGGARHRVEPVRRPVLRPQPGRNGELDPGLHHHLPGAHRPGRGHLHRDQLVEGLHRQQRGLRRRQPALGGPVQHDGRRTAGRLARPHDVAVHLDRPHGRRPQPLQRRARPRTGAGQRLTPPEPAPVTSSQVTGASRCPAPRYALNVYTLCIVLGVPHTCADISAQRSGVPCPRR
ncbi:protein of unknown function [Streptomyces sp. KY75]|nr:protein of unknown function [Streptomyces sp. KY70]CAD5986408.1 protein of unknown function [Streptomyces sp. KY75]